MLTKQPKKIQRSAYSPGKTKGTGYKYLLARRPRPVSAFISEERLAELHKLLVAREQKAFKAVLINEVMKEVLRGLKEQANSFVMLDERFDEVIKAWNQLVTRPDAKGEFIEADVIELGHEELLPALEVLDRILTSLGGCPKRSEVIDYMEYWLQLVQRSAPNLTADLRGFIGAVSHMLLRGESEEEIQEYVRKRSKRLKSSLNGVIGMNLDALPEVVKEFSNRQILLRPT